MFLLLLFISLLTHVHHSYKMNDDVNPIHKVLPYRIITDNDIRDPDSGVNSAFVVMSQENEFHRENGAALKKNIEQQLLALNINHSKVFVAPTDFKNMHGYWTFLPLIREFSKFDNYTWIVFLDEKTVLNVGNLFGLLYKHNLLKNEFVGYALLDTEATIIHHFDEPATSVAYPHLSSGFAVAFSLVFRTAERLLKVKSIGLDFSIDEKYELAKFFNAEFDVPLIHEENFCIAKTHEKCATWVTRNFPNCRKKLSKENLFFAIKTCEKFHKNRIPVVKKTWFKQTIRAVFFSDKDDPIIPTLALPVENVSHGHCEKTLAILKYFQKKRLPHELWLIIADDDTIFSVPRLLHVLSCYNSSEPVAVGERYGYGNIVKQGYDYLTGGAGIALTVPAVNMVASVCKCPTIYSPDDMIIGMCLKQVGIHVTHSPHFHQARPWDYHEQRLICHLPVSFHKFWKIDPYYVFRSYLHDPKEGYHDEL